MVQTAMMMKGAFILELSWLKYITLSVAVNFWAGRRSTRTPYMIGLPDLWEDPRMGVYVDVLKSWKGGSTIE